MLQVGEVARQLGLNPQTLYFYERIGLIPSPKRTEAGYRLFAEEDIDRLSFIQSAKALGLSLEEIKELLTLQDGQALSCEEVYQRLLKKVEQIEANIQQLQALKAELLPLLERSRQNSQQPGQEKIEAQMEMPEPEVTRPLWQNALFFAVMVGILVFANWAKPDVKSGLWADIYAVKWFITSGFGVALAVMLIFWFGLKASRVAIITVPTVVLVLQFPHLPMLPFAAAVIGLSWLTSTAKGEAQDWFVSSWDFAKQILPLLLMGVLVAGALLGRPGHEALIPSQWVAQAVGENSLLSNFVAAFAGAFMYFATLTEVPILQGLIGSGMGQGPALSLPNMLVIRSIMGTKKTVVFVSLVIVMATVSGMVYGAIWG